MISYTDGRNRAGVWTKNAQTANLTYLDQIANSDYQHICALKDWPFLERNRTVSTTANTQATALPYDCDLVREVSVIPNGSTIRYTPEIVADRRFWDQLNLRSYTSDIPEYAYVFAGALNLWPVPAQTGNTIYVTQKSRVIDLSAADYTTGTISAVTNGQTTITGSGTTWTANMVGRWIRISYADGANTGDGIWYEITGYSSATSITIGRAYGGNSIAAGSAAYTIGQMPLLPEAFHDLPWLWAAGSYWRKEADERAGAYFAEHGSYSTPPTGRIKELINGYSSQDTSMVLDYADDDYDRLNPNLLVSL